MFYLLIFAMLLHFRDSAGSGFGEECRVQNARSGAAGGSAVSGAGELYVTV